MHIQIYIHLHVGCIGDDGDRDAADADADADDDVVVDDDDHDILSHACIHEHTQATPRSTARSGLIAATLSVQRGRVPN